MKHLAMVIVAGTFLMGASAAHAFLGLFGSDALKAENGVVRIPVSEVSDGKAHFYSYEANGKTVRFFIVKSRDNVLRAAFDACDVCWREGKGYTQNGDLMVCNNCGQSFHSTRINEVKGGCNPAPLDRREEDGHLVISESDLFSGIRYFL